MYPSRSYLVKGLFPVRSISLFSAGSGIGKTTLIFQLCDEWIKHGTFLGRKAIPNPRIAYFAYDRTLEDTYDLLNRLKLDWPDETLHLHSFVLNSPPMPYPSLSQIEPYNFLIIDGIDCMIQDFNKFCQVQGCLQNFMKLLKGKEKAALGILGVSKLKIGERFVSSRSSGLGSVAWGRLCGTYIEGDMDAEDPEEIRNFKISERHAPPETLQYVFNEAGILVPKVETDSDTKVYILLKELPAEFKTSEAEAIAEKLSVSRASVFRYLQRLQQLSKLTQPKHGVWVKTKIN